MILNSFIWDVWRMPLYMLGSEGEAAVVDPQRDVELYLTAPAEQG